jgi:hypothetical protein
MSETSPPALAANYVQEANHPESTSKHSSDISHAGVTFWEFLYLLIAMMLTANTFAARIPFRGSRLEDISVLLDNLRTHLPVPLCDHESSG